MACDEIQISASDSWLNDRLTSTQFPKRDALAAAVETQTQGDVPGKSQNRLQWHQAAALNGTPQTKLDNT
jgi:hypothetical protein